MSLWQEIYSSRLKLVGAENINTLLAANNYADTLVKLKRFEEAKTLMRKSVPAARRVLGDHHHTFAMRANYAAVLYNDPDATLDDLREAVSTLEEIEPTAQRVLGPANPTAAGIEECLQDARVVENARVRRAAVDALVAGGAKLIVP